MNRSLVFLTAILCAALLAAADKKPAPGPTVITAQEAKEKYHGKADVVFIDNRPDPKFCAGRIPGAVNLTYLAPGAPDNRLTKESLAPYAGKKLVFYCGGHDRAKNAVEAARSWGIDPKLLFWFKEGFPAWEKLGYPVEKLDDACPI
ncbi:MAG TPA: rhodanese-like domain-containing protein [bacterium]|nr:rhodanese-like domain-containing protein [bacterium]